MLRHLLDSLRLTAATLVVCSFAYPAGLLAFATVAAPDSAAGSLVVRDGVVVGSALIGQSFTSPRYVWGRPSAVAHDAAATGGSNLSPANPALTERAREIVALLALPAGTDVPADLVTTSGSGVDPHVSLAGALAQVPRVAAARGMKEDVVRALVLAATEERAGLALLGEEPVVNVLRVNLALDAHADTR